MLPDAIEALRELYWSNCSYLQPEQRESWLGLIQELEEGRDVAAIFGDGGLHPEEDS